MKERTTKPTTEEDRRWLRDNWSVSEHGFRQWLVGSDRAQELVIRLLDDYEVLEGAAKEAIRRNLSYYNLGSQACNAKERLEWALEGKDAKPVRYV